jgi:hypothetical protein
MRQQASSYTAKQRAFLDAVRQTGLLRRELEDTLPAAWDKGQGFAARLAVADRAEARALSSLPALDTPFLRAAGSRLAQFDRDEAGRADGLARAASQTDWNGKLHAFWSGELQADMDTVRVNIGLPSSD